MPRWILPFVFALIWAGTAHAVFQIETVDTGNTGFTTDTSVGPSNHAAICYYDAAAKELKVAECDTSWHVYVVDDSGDVGQSCSMYTDAADDPHVAYGDSAGDLLYAYRGGGQWYTQTVLSRAGDEVIARGICMRTDNAGWPRITFQDDFAQALYYVWTDSGGAYDFLVDQTRVVGGQKTGIAVISPTLSHIAYFDSSEGVLWLATGAAQNWQFQPVDGQGGGANIGWDLSLAAAANGDLRLAYYDQTHGRLKFAWGPPNALQTELVDSYGWPGSPLDLTLDAAGAPHVCYYDNGNQMLRYAYRDAARWHIFEIDSGDHVGEDCSLAIDSQGVITIAYRAAGEGSLRAARGDSSGMPEFNADDDDDNDDDDNDDNDDDNGDDDDDNDDVTPDDDSASDDDSAVDDDSAIDDDATPADDDESPSDDDGSPADDDSGPLHAGTAASRGCGC